MLIDYTRTFGKQFKKLPKKVQNKFDTRVARFIENPTDPLLKIHSLKGDRLGLMSMNVSADYRALFTWEDDLVIFYEIGTHSQLYS